VPAGLLVDRAPDTINIVMSKMPGSPTLSAGPGRKGDAAKKLAAQIKEYGHRVYSSESDEPDQNSTSLSPDKMAAAIDFLARMHTHTWGSARAGAAVAGGLQPQGGFWYLDTRHEEWEAMPTRGWEGRLRRAARAIDRRLKDDVHQCVIHGDAKPDNMCYEPAGAVSMCDFQYCGRASPMKDLAYLLCCAADVGCSPASSGAHLARYHERLSAALSASGAAPEIPPLAELKTALDLAYADLCRWMSGRGYWGDVPNLQYVIVFGLW
jgi:Ser/Thr protein kinase RdoA (MazF antagonist)